MGLGLPAGIGNGFVGGSDRVEDKVIHPTLVLGRKGRIRIEGPLNIGTAATAAVHARNLAGDLAGVAIGIEGRDPPCA